MICFADHLYRALELAQFAEHRNNYDEVRFGPAKPCGALESINYQCRRIARRLGWYRRTWINVASSSALAAWTPLLEELDWLYHRLADDASRSLLVDIIAYRIMGARAVRLPLSNPTYLKKRDELSKLGDESNQIDIGFMGWKLSLFDLSSIGYPIKLYMRNPIVSFDVEQYAHEASDIRADDGDVVIEGGGCYGDTAAYFAHKVGPSGSVHVFEFVPSNLNILERNLDLNPTLKQRVTIARHPLWNESDMNVFVQDRGPASNVSMKERPGYEIKAQTVTIDDYVTRSGLDRIDFIKLDIEGAEENALFGAEHTIRTMHPKMAVCLYHSPKDFVRLPRLLDQYCPNYKFYIKHATMHAEETVLFAKAD
jgi:FkbM family methyltransferase